MPAPVTSKSSCTHIASHPCPALSRRQVLGAAAGAALLSLPPWPRLAAAGEAGSMLLNCMDYRLIDDVVRYMDGRNLTDNYDQVILAGASLGALTGAQPAWGSTFWSHLDLALELHHVHSLIVIDHRDCGAYKLLFGEDYSLDPVREKEVHAEQMRKLRAMVVERHPSLPTELLLMSLDGSVETIS
ncbi:MAG TPA: hypothetical protein PK694_01725 [Rhodospirillales bacterium]|nr:hypothetical protein [Rhodospirillales bacterium]